MKIGLYGGTFDPVHHGHLILAREAMETLALDRVVFIPAARSPHKSAAASAPDAARWEMLQLAISGEPRFSANDCELRRPAPSYAIDTILELREHLANGEKNGTGKSRGELFYFIGEDNLEKLPSWHRFSELEKLVQFVILARGEKSSASLTANFPRIARRIEISATEIRSRIAKGESIRYLVPETVREFILRENLYQKTNH